MRIEIPDELIKDAQYKNISITIINEDIVNLRLSDEIDYLTPERIINEILGVERYAD